MSITTLPRPVRHVWHNHTWIMEPIPAPDWRARQREYRNMDRFGIPDMYKEMLLAFVPVLKDADDEPTAWGFWLRTTHPPETDAQLEIHGELLYLPYPGRGLTPVLIVERRVDGERVRTRAREKVSLKNRRRY